MWLEFQFWLQTKKFSVWGLVLIHFKNSSVNQFLDLDSRLVRLSEVHTWARLFTFLFCRYFLSAHITAMRKSTVMQKWLVLQFLQLSSPIVSCLPSIYPLCPTHAFFKRPDSHVLLLMPFHLSYLHFQLDQVDKIVSCVPMAVSRGMSNASCLNMEYRQLVFSVPLVKNI